MYNTLEPYMLGVLSEEQMAAGAHPIFINNSNEIQFRIRILSKRPNSMQDLKSVTCWGADLYDYGFEDTYDKEARIENLKYFLDGKLFVFQIEKRNRPSGDYFTAKNIHLIPKKESFVDSESYLPVPVFSERDAIEHSQGFRSDEFIANLLAGKFIGRNDQVSHETEDTPRFIFYKTFAEELFVAGMFDSHHHAHGGFSFTVLDEAVKYAKVEKAVVDELYFFQKVGFVNIDAEDRIIKLLNETETDNPAPAAEEEERQRVNELRMIAPQREVSSEVGLKIEEEEFIAQFIAETKKMNLQYKTEDLYNFHTCVKTGGLTILAGMSGTGKSQLINAYQRGMHIDSGKFAMVPVSPTWTDDSDLIGYPDIMNNVYRPADTGIVNLLIDAENNGEETFIICFDEMNLAKVEHYFSQFLSVLEMDKGRRKLKLYNKELENKFYNGSFYPPEVSIGDNVIFIGTVNLDDSTHHFSDKVLDRANLIELHIEPFTNMLELEQEVPEKTADHKPKSSYAIHAFMNRRKKMELKKEELELLWAIHSALQEVSSTLGIGPRIVKQIDSYMKNLSDVKDCPIDRKRALDLQIAQRVLPKIRGTEELLRHITGTAENSSNEAADSALLKIFNDYSNCSAFEKSRMVILEKAKELKRNGFAF